MSHISKGQKEPRCFFYVLLFVLFCVIAFLVGRFLPLDFPGRQYVGTVIFVLGSYCVWLFAFVIDPYADEEHRFTQLFIAFLIFLLLTFFWYMVFFGKGIYY